MSDSWFVHLLLASPGQRWGPLISAVTVLDVLVVLIAATAAARGWQRGITRLALGAAGLVAGVLAGLWATAHLVPAGASSGVGVLLAFGFVVAGALIGSGIGAAVGWRAAAVLTAIHLRAIDRAAGAIARGVLAVVVCWLLAAGVAAFAPTAPATTAAALTSGSTVLRSVGQVAPPLSALGRRVVDQVPLAADLVAMAPITGEQVLAGRPGEPALAAVATAAAPATVRVQGRGCGSGVTGSGFVAAQHLVVTNAHVVAATTALSVSDAAGIHPATAVVVDARDDLAVLRVDADLAEALPVADRGVATGSAAVVLGYPAGGPLDAQAAVVTARSPLHLDASTSPGSAVPALSASPEYRLATQVRPGNSGGPLLDSDGQVIGVVNARSLDDPDIGYAISSTRVGPVVAAAATATPAGTGACTAAPAAAR